MQLLMLAMKIVICFTGFDIYLQESRALTRSTFPLTRSLLLLSLLVPHSDGSFLQSLSFIQRMLHLVPYLITKKRRHNIMPLSQLSGSFESAALISVLVSVAIPLSRDACS